VQRRPAADEGADAVGHERARAVLALGGETLKDKQHAEAGVEEHALVALRVRPRLVAA